MIIRNLLFKIYKSIKVIRIYFSFIMSTLIFKLSLFLNNCDIPKQIKVSGNVVIRLNKTKALILGNNITLISRYLTNHVGDGVPIIFEVFEKGKIEIGNNTGISSTSISARSRVKIGNNVKIGGACKIFDHDFHSLNFQNRRTSVLDFINVKSNEIIIGDDVFIGANCIILKSVIIGERSIISAGCTLSNITIPPDSIVKNKEVLIIKNKYCDEY